MAFSFSLLKFVGIFASKMLLLTRPSHRGLRACPGQQIALAVVAYVLTRILQNFKDIQSRDERPWKEGLGLTLYNANGVHVAFTPA